MSPLRDLGGAVAARPVQATILSAVVILPAWVLLGWGGSDPGERMLGTFALASLFGGHLLLLLLLAAEEDRERASTPGFGTGWSPAWNAARRWAGTWARGGGTILLLMALLFLLPLGEGEVRLRPALWRTASYGLSLACLGLVAWVIWGLGIRGGVVLSLTAYLGLGGWALSSGLAAEGGATSVFHFLLPPALLIVDLPGRAELGQWGWIGAHGVGALAFAAVMFVVGLGLRRLLTPRL